ncbi:GerAB/ArcD/ProY family transporter [Paenibacillus sp. ATY16]|uniref:GerAB/ArcD/ProY family transporter n=1 Tax=Paenibacillus sp. ATY16 TaxID=1759312 RepID=UPI00200D64E3|nr:GerAB/ArcD/ProY family transporter [Paenibacillus sp. ATY16]MCK9862089.1 spore germination protein [Paenibacillus sp. ATY16]
MQGNQQTVSSRQLIALMILFEFGTAIVVHIGLASNHATWLSVLLAIPGALLLYSVYLYLHQQYPELIVSAYIRKIVGPILAWPISLFILAYFIYNASRNLREAGDLLIASAYDETPLFIINATMVLVMIYVLGKGIEVICRLAQVYVYVIIILGIFGLLAVFFSGEVELSNIFPINGGSWQNVVKTAYPSILLFPFGELFAFSTVLPHLKDKKKAGKTGMVAILFSGFVLSLTQAVQLLVLGDSIYIRSTFSLLTMISVVNIANFLQRLDAIVMLTLIICVFFKMSLYSYAIMAIWGDLFRIHTLAKLAAPVGIVVLFMSIFSAWSFPEHVSEGQTSSMLMLFIVTVALPLLLLLVHLAKKTFRQLREAGHND